MSSGETALWLKAAHGPLEIGAAATPTPGPHEIVVRNRAIAVNPVDWMALSVGELIFPWLSYPCVLGTDVAGEVVAVGAAVTGLAPGDRVLGHALGTEKASRGPAEGAFQSHTLLRDHMVTPLPPQMSFEDGATLPLGLSTAACGLFQKEYLALARPSLNPAPKGETILIWGGSTSVGCNAIQLAVAAGYEVIATASLKNAAYLKSLGAQEVFDYRAGTVVADIRQALKGRRIAGALAIGEGSADLCLEIVRACHGVRFVAMATPAVSFASAPTGRGRRLWLVRTLARMIAATAWTLTRARLSGVGMKFIWGGALAGNDLGPAIYRDFLPKALAQGRYRPAPPPHVVGHGLEAIPAALETQKAGVSATKIVVSL